MRVSDLSTLTQIKRIRHLVIEWNTKLVDLEPLRQLPQLETLAVIDAKKAQDLSPLSALRNLTAFAFMGGIWNTNTALSLEPLTVLPKLRQVWLANLRVMEGGLRPLARCQSLEWLQVSNQFDTSDYAYLSVALPNVICDMFVPWIPFKVANVGDRMVVGKGKPILDSKSDGEKIRRFENQFRAMQERFRAQLG